MHRSKRRHSRTAHNAPEVSHSTRLRSTRRGPHSRSHVYSTRRGSYPQVAAPSAAMAELYTTPGPSARQRSTSREKDSYSASPSSGYGGECHGSTSVSRSSSSPERRIPHYFGSAHGPTYVSISGHHSHSNKEDPSVDYRRDPYHLHGESRPSTRDQPRLDSQASASENRDVLDPVDYIRSWQGTLQTAIPPNALPTKGVVPTGPDLASGRPQTLATSSHVSAAARKVSIPIVEGKHQPTSSRAVQLSNHSTSDSAPPPRSSSWLSWFGFGKKPMEPAPPPILRGRTLVNRKKVLTGAQPSSPATHPPMPVAPSGTVRVPAPSRAQDVPVGRACPPRLQHISTATQPFVSRPRTTVDVGVQTIDQLDSIAPYLDPPSPVPSLSWLLEDDANGDDGPSEQPTIFVNQESNSVEQQRPQRSPSPSTNIHSLFPPLPPHIPQPEAQVNAVMDVVKSVYAAHPEVSRTSINLLVPLAFRCSCPEFYLFDGLQNLDASYMRLMAGFHKLNVFYEEINQKPENSNPSPEFIPIPSSQIPQDSYAHRLALGGMLTHIVKFKWILHILYGTTVGMTGFLRANDTRPISPEESQSYVKMRDDIRRFTDRARGSYIPPTGVRPKDELDLDEVRNLVEMLILAGGKMFTKDMGQPIATPPTLPPAGPFLVADRPTTVVALTTAHEPTTASQAEVQLAVPEGSSTTPALHAPSPPFPNILQAPPPAYEANSDVTLGSHSPDLQEQSATLRLPDGFLPTSHPQGGVRWSDSRKREDILWNTDSTIAKEMRDQFVERIASEHSILSALLDMAGDNLDTKTALALIVQKYLGEYVPKERKDATSRDDLWNLITGPEAFMGMAEVVREVAVQLSSQRGVPAGLDGYIMKGLVEALMKMRETRPEFVQAFSALKEVIPQPPRTVPPSPIRANADSKSKRKWTDDETEPTLAESPSKRRKLEEDARKMPPPSKSIPSSGHASTSAASSETHTIGGVTTSKASATSSSTTFGGAPPTNGSRLTSLPRLSGQPMPSVVQNYLRRDNGASKKIPPSARQQFKKRSEFHGKMHPPGRFASPGVRILPPLPDQFGYSGPATASSSQAEASASTSTTDSSSVEADSRTSSHATEPRKPVWLQPVYPIKRAAFTKSSASASTLTRASPLSVISSSALSSAQVASGSYTSSSRTTTSSFLTSASSPAVSGAHSTVHSTSGASLCGNLSTSVPNSDIRFVGQSGPPVVSGWEGDMHTVSGTSLRSVSASSASSRGYSAAMHPANWDVEMNDDEFEEIDVFSAD